MPRDNEHRLPILARLAPDVLALGQALLDGDAGEARFRTHVVLTSAETAGLGDIVLLARSIEGRLLASGVNALKGIGEAYAALLDAVNPSA